MIAPTQPNPVIIHPLVPAECGVDVSGVQPRPEPTRDIYVVRDAKGDREFSGFGLDNNAYCDCHLEADKLPLDAIKARLDPKYDISVYNGVSLQGLLVVSISWRVCCVPWSHLLAAAGHTAFGYHTDAAGVSRCMQPATWDCQSSRGPVKAMARIAATAKRGEHGRDSCMPSIGDTRDASR